MSIRLLAAAAVIAAFGLAGPVVADSAVPPGTKVYFVGLKDGDKLLISTDDGSWKTKRINNTPRVTIQRSGALGKPKGEPVEAVARNLPKSENRRVFDMVTKKYWWHAWWWIPQAIVRGGIVVSNSNHGMEGRASRLGGRRRPKAEKPESQKAFRAAPVRAAATSG